MGRPKIINKKVKLSITIDKEISDVLDESCANKSKYIEDLIRKDLKLTTNLIKTFKDE